MMSPVSSSGPDESGLVPHSPQGLGLGLVRLGNLIACVLLIAGATGWWMSTRIMDANGFSDVVAKSLHDRPVRDYLADEATLRLAKQTTFVASARPLATSALSAALDTQLVEEAVRSATKRAHRQAFSVNRAPLTELDAIQANQAIRTALQALNPGVASKLPPDVLRASNAIAQSAALDAISRARPWILWLYLPALVTGVALMLLTRQHAADRSRALRISGESLAVSGALLGGVGLAGPTYAWLTDGVESKRADAIVEFVGRLVGRLQGAGFTMLVVGLLILVGLNSNGPDVWRRVRCAHRWGLAQLGHARGQLVAGATAGAVAILVATKSTLMATGLAISIVVVLLYTGVVLAFGALGVQSSPATVTNRMRPVSLVAVSATIVLSALASAGGALAVVSAASAPSTVSKKVGGCNGFVELCDLRLNQVMFPASHNAMSSSAANFLSAEHTISISEQLNAGARALLLDLYYGYDDHGLIRTNITGGANRAQLLADQGPEAVAALDRLGALTGSSTRPGRGKEMYLCHNYCELGASLAVEEFNRIRTFLERNRNEVVIVVIEDHIRPNDIKILIDKAQLADRVWMPDPRAKVLPTLGELVEPERIGGLENKRRLIVLSERYGGQYPWLIPAYSLMQETPFSFATVSAFNCEPNRGGTDKPMLLVNHWLRTGNLPSPAGAKIVNSGAELTRRIQQCGLRRKKLPNIVATDFTEIGDLYKTVTLFNSAVATLSGITAAVDADLEAERASGGLTVVELQEVADLRRLPRLSPAAAQLLLGSGVSVPRVDPRLIQDAPVVTSVPPK